MPFKTSNLKIPGSSQFRPWCQVNLLIKNLFSPSVCAQYTGRMHQSTSRQITTKKAWLYFGYVVWITVTYFWEYLFRQRYSMFRKDKTIQNTFLLFKICKTCNSLETACRQTLPSLKNICILRFLREMWFLGKKILSWHNEKSKVSSFLNEKENIYNVSCILSSVSLSDQCKIGTLFCF